MTMQRHSSLRLTSQEAPIALSDGTLGPATARVSARQIIPENFLLHGDVSSSGIRFLEVLPQDICSHRCSWCFTTSSRTSQHLDAYQAFVRLTAFARSGGKSVLFSGGGEPLLCRYLVEPYGIFGHETIIQWLDKLGLVSAVITNGVNLSRFIEHNRLAVTKMAFIRISLDAYDSKLYAQRHQTSEREFERVLKGIRRLVDLRGVGYQPAIGISFVVSRHSGIEPTERDVNGVARLSRSLAVDFVQFKHAHIAGKRAADKTMQHLYALCEETYWGRTEYWVHRYRAPRPRSLCVVPTVAQVLGAGNTRYPCCHRQDAPLPGQGTGPGFEEAEIADCSSNICRYRSLNDTLLEARSGTSQTLKAFDRLKRSLMLHGFHPYRLFPSAPDLVGYPKPDSR